MEEHITKVEIYGTLIEETITNFMYHSLLTSDIYERDTHLKIIHKNGIQTFIFSCPRTGKILIKFDTQEDYTLVKVPDDVPEKNP